MRPLIIAIIITAVTRMTFQQNLLTDIRESNTTSYRTIVKNLTDPKKPIKASRIMIEKTLIRSGDKKIRFDAMRLDFFITIFYEDDPFSQGLHLNFHSILSPVDRIMENVEISDMKYSIASVGEVKIDDYEEVVYAKINSSMFDENFDLDPNSEISIYSAFNKKEKAF